MGSHKIWLVAISILYVTLHVIQLELFPLYHFGMYSEKRTMPEKLISYEIRLDGQLLDYRSLNYRQYTYITNTLNEYDALKSSNNVNPSSHIISKYFDVIPMPAIEAFLLKPHRYENPDAQMRSWLKSVFPGYETIQVIKKERSSGEGSTALLKDQVILQ